jgi:hypothetical protein
MAEGRPKRPVITMNDKLPPVPYAQPDVDRDTERMKQVTVAGWTTGLSAFFALGALATSPSWPVAFGVAAVSAMVGTACYFMLRR